MIDDATVNFRFRTARAKLKSSFASFPFIRVCTYIYIVVVHQYYQSEVNNEYVIRGNAAILKCSIPSFVAEFVQVVGWQDDQGNSFNPDEKNGRIWRIVSSVNFAASPSTSYEGIDRSLEIACFPNFQKLKVDP